jgi:DNA-binding transcriptional LysR family regulator
VNTAEAALDTVVAGLGLTRVLSYQAVDARSRGHVMQVLESSARDEIPVHLLYPGGAHPPPKLRAFIDRALPQLRARLAAIDAALR